MSLSSSVIERGLIFCAKLWNILWFYCAKLNFFLLCDLGYMNNDNQVELLLLLVSHNNFFRWCLEHLLHKILLACSLFVSQPRLRTAWVERVTSHYCLQGRQLTGCLLHHSCEIYVHCMNKFVYTLLYSKHIHMHDLI